jgi:hypothetical protein
MSLDCKNVVHRHALVAALNNRGVTLFDNGNERMAHIHFRDALKLLMGEISLDEASYRLTEQAKKIQLMKSSVSTSLENEMNTAVLENMESQVKIRIKYTSTELIHSSCIRISSFDKAYSCDALIHSTIVSSIIVFNLALVFHVHALDDDRISSIPTNQAFGSARALYRKCLLLLTEADVLVVSTCNPCIDLLIMALYNNIAHCCYEMILYEESTTYFDSLIRFSVTVMPSRYQEQLDGSDHDNTSLSQREISKMKSIYLFNAMILRTPPTLAGAA